MSYFVKEIFYTLQGEGAQVGRTAVFCRFSGCNLWNGYAQDKANASCKFCDTDFVGVDGLGGGKFNTAPELVSAIKSYWRGDTRKMLVVCTGGEPLLQLDEVLVDELHSAGFKIAIETNGTLLPPNNLSESTDWVTVSPKSGAPLILNQGNELKLVFPQATSPAKYENLPFDHFFLQPMDGPNLKQNTADAVEYCLQNPLWRLSLQTHKFLGIR